MKKSENFDMDGIRYLFKQVEVGALSAERAEAIFSSSYGGYVIYIPVARKWKIEKIKQLLKQGLGPRSIAIEAKTTVDWVMKVKRRMEKDCS